VVADVAVEDAIEVAVAAEVYVAVSVVADEADEEALEVAVAAEVYVAVSVDADEADEEALEVAVATEVNVAVSVETDEEVDEAVAVSVGLDVVLEVDVEVLVGAADELDDDADVKLEVAEPVAVDVVIGAQPYTNAAPTGAAPESSAPMTRVPPLYAMDPAPKKMLLAMEAGGLISLGVHPPADSTMRCTPPLAPDRRRPTSTAVDEMALTVYPNAFPVSRLNTAC
jgi:hypothetical protein